MIATFAIEIGLFLYVIIRYKMTPITRLVGALLVLLATFQYAEFNICQGAAASEYFARLGYVAITLLPPVGLHLTTKIARRNPRHLIMGGYALGGAFAFSFALTPNTFESYACTGNYAVFQLANNLGILYFAYYYLLMFIGITLCIRYSGFVSKRRREALTYQAFGYLSFIIPTGIVNAVNPTTIDGIPSIMCGFAAIYALVLTFAIVPRVLEVKESSHSPTTQ